MKTCFQHRPRLFLSVILLASLELSVHAMQPVGAGDARVKEIAAMLPPHPEGFGAPITNRAAWNALVERHPGLTRFVQKAEKLAAQPLPDQPDSLYLDFSKTGDRDRFQKVAFARRARVQIFTLAECIENKGRFIAPLELAIAEFCLEPTWVWPAHDGGLRNFHGKVIDIDLGSSTLGADLATADFLLGDKLSPATRNLIHASLERRIFSVWRAVMSGEHHEFAWQHASNNWTSVCFDNITGAALMELASPQDRAQFVAYDEKNIHYYFDGGFTPDGYCAEGLGYWNYGFGHFVILSENIRQATGGKLDLFREPYVAQASLFGLRSEILNGVHTSIADCNPGQQPAGGIMDYVSRRFDFFPANWSKGGVDGDTLYLKATYAFMPDDLPKIQTDNSGLAEFSWRTWFPDAGVLICRPGPDAKVPFAVAIKGGNNGECSHSHLDLGSFSVVAGTNMVICDPGGEVYTRRTFSSHRFDSMVLNSFGHAVPVVAGQLQRAGAEAKAVVLGKNFSATNDSITFDLRSAYAVSDLTKLNRTFEFQRGASPSLTVRDAVQFSAPENFESALITWGKIKRAGENELRITDGGAAVNVFVDTHGQPFHLRQITIDEHVDTPRQPIHLGIVLDNKIASGDVELKIVPVKK